MTTADDLRAFVKEWMEIDDEMKTLQRELKGRRARKKELTEQLVDIMKTNEIDCFDVNNGKLIYAKNKVKTPLSKKHLLESLNQYFAEHPEIEGADVGSYILDARQVKIKESIRRKGEKNIS